MKQPQDRAGRKVYLRGCNPLHCERVNAADRTEDTGNGTPRTKTAERPQPPNRAFILRQLRLKTHTPLQPGVREMD